MHSGPLRVFLVTAMLVPPCLACNRTDAPQVTPSGNIAIATNGVPEAYANDPRLLQHYLFGFHEGVQIAVRDIESIEIGTIQRADILSSPATLDEEAFDKGRGDGYNKVISAAERAQFNVGTKLLDEFKSVVDSDAGLTNFKNQILETEPAH